CYGPDRLRRHFPAGRFQASHDSETGRACQRPSRRTVHTLHRAIWRSCAAERLDKPDDRVLAEPVRRPRGPAQKDGSMNVASTETLSIVVEREVAYPPEKIWRALTQPHLI